MTGRRGRHASERGIALIVALMVVALLSALIVGFTATVMSDQRFRAIEQNRSQAFYGANAGIEKLTADLGNLFFTTLVPSASQLTALTATAAKPSVSGISFTADTAPDILPASSLTRCASPNGVVQQGGNGYAIRYCAAPNGTPVAASTTPIVSGPFEGLVAQQTPYQVDVTARTTSGGDVHLVRLFESVSIPVFQFGVFSDVDLSFFAGPDFSFGGRVHTNGNLFLAQGANATLTLGDKVTAVKEVIRQELQNGLSIDTSTHTGTVNMASAPSVFRALARTEGSVTGGPSSSTNEPAWHTVSLSTYNSWIRNGRTGAKVLNLPVITVGGANPDLVRRPVVNENTTNPVLLNERLFSKASLRVLLSDTAADITSLPTVTSAPPVALDGNWRTARPGNGLGTYGPVDATHPPVARSAGLTTQTITTGASAGTAKTLTLSGGVPAYFKVPDTLTVTKGSSVWTLTGCSSSKTPTTFTCTAISPSHASTTTASPATVSATLSTLDGAVSVSTTTTASWVNSGLTLTVASTAAFSQDSFWVGDSLISCTGYTATTVTGCTLPATVANNATLTTSALSAAGTGTLGGFLKVERGNADGSWTDVTMELLNYGIAGPNLAGIACADPTPNAVLRIERLRDNNLTACTYGPGYANLSTDYWPNVLFDPREALVRDTAATGLLVGGVIHYVTLDVANLSKWFKGASPYGAGTGPLSRTDNGGYTVYFSDRRNNRNEQSVETAEYGWEDVVNRASPAGAPDGVLETGEDMNGNGRLETYGSIPNYGGVYNTAPPGATAPLTVAARPSTVVSRGHAQVNRAVLFRRALKLTRGADIAGAGVTGLTVVAENPVYVQGDWNATGGSFSGAHAATAVIADAVTLLSNNWTDSVSFSAPYSHPSRPRLTPAWYRLAVIAGKSPAFPHIDGLTSDNGTDGGVHNFLRFLEARDQPVNFDGSIATFFYSRQATGPFKCCATVYGAPSRNYTFDTDFLNPAKLPPNTPVFRDLNAVGFAQDLRPGR